MNTTENAIAITQERVVYRNSYGNLYDDQVRFPSGRSGTYLRFVWAAPYSVAILPVLASGHVVLLRTFRHAIRDWILEVPKGFGDKQCPPDAVANKELSEETGFRAKELKLVSTIYCDPAFVANPMYAYIAAGCVPEGARQLEESEVHKSPLRVTATQALTMLQEGQITDCVTQMLLLHYSTAR